MQSWLQFFLYLLNKSVIIHGKKSYIILISASGTCTDTTENGCATCSSNKGRILEGNKCVCLTGAYDSGNDEEQCWMCHSFW